MAQQKDIRRMKGIDQLKLQKNEKKALQELGQRILERFPDAQIILYGSKARGDFDEESDIDVLILLECDVNDSLREKIFSMSFRIELKYNVVFGILVEAMDFWESPLAKAMPIHWDIDKEGIPVK